MNNDRIESLIYKGAAAPRNTRVPSVDVNQAQRNIQKLEISGNKGKYQTKDSPPITIN